MRRELGRNDTLGTVDYFHYDDTDDTFVIETVQDIEDVTEANKALFNDAPGRFGGDMVRVAQIPMVLYQQFMKEGKLKDQAFLKRWLNDPDNRVFRTRPGRL